MIEVKNLNKKFDSLNIINDFNLIIDEGETVAIIGPSGCGKTTLLHCITGLDTKYNGEVYLAKQKQIDYLAKKRIAVVLQQYSNFEWLNVEDNIKTAFINSILPKSENDKILNTLLKELQLEKFSKYYISKLSGGMKQRVAVARALAQETEILAFDEPFGALDIPTRSSLQVLFKKINNSIRKTSLFITHDIEEAIFIADRIIVLSKRPTSIITEFKSDFKNIYDLNCKYSIDFIDLKKQIENILYKE